MAVHTAWHILTLASTLVAAAGGVILVLAPLVFDEPPPGLIKARPAVVGAVIFAASLFFVEWIGVH